MAVFVSSVVLCVLINVLVFPSSLFAVLIPVFSLGLDINRLKIKFLVCLCHGRTFFPFIYASFISLGLVPEFSLG